MNEKSSEEFLCKKRAGSLALYALALLALNELIDSEPPREYGKHRFLGGTCVDCGHPLAEICLGNYKDLIAATTSLEERMKKIHFTLQHYGTDGGRFNR